MPKRPALKVKENKKAKKSKYVHDGSDDFSDFTESSRSQEEEFFLEQEFDEEEVDEEEPSDSFEIQTTPRATKTKKATTPTVSASKPKQTTPRKTAASPNTKKDGLKSRMNAVSHADLISTVCTLVSNGSLDETTLLDALPEPNCKVQVEALRKASNAINRALPHSRFGDSCDHFGYKRCTTAVMAFKRVWKENVDKLSGSSVFLEYATQALDILEDSVDFISGNDNAYKGMCLKQLNPAVTKLEKDKSLSDAQKQSLKKLVDALESVREDNEAKKKQRQEQKKSKDSF